MATSSRNSGRPRPQHSRQNEIVSILLLALGLLLFLCLITYNPNDPSSNAASQEARSNFIGIIGSETAVRFLQTFGLIAYILPALIVLIAWQCFKSLSLRVSVMSVVAFLLFVLSLVGLMGLTDYKVFDSSVYVGGIIGYFIGWLLVPWITKIGAFILLAAVGIASFIYITNFSLTIVFADVRHYAEMLIGWIRNHPALEAEALSKGDKGTPVENLYAAENKHAKKLREDAKEGGKKIGAAITGFISKLGEPPKKAGEAEKVPEVEEVKEEKKPAPTIIARDIKPAKPEEEFKPKEITVSEETETPPNVDGMDVTIEERVDLGGDLAAAEGAKPGPEFAAEEAAEPRPKPAPKKKVQNFDKYTLPKSEFLTEPPPATEQREEELKAVAQELEAKCNEFKVGGRVAVIRQGPVVTTYEFKPDSGVKYSRITGLTDDLALALKAQSIRIDRIPGKAYVGIEVPNPNRETIFLREVIESAKFEKSESKLTIALGKKIDGENYVTDLVKMPHLLIAGATGAGKSVGVNSLVVSILYKARPDEVKFIMVDPKRLELGVYADIPHLATPIITDPKRAAISLKWAVHEMERRYKELAGWGVRNIEGFNKEVPKRNFIKDYDENGEPWKPLPYIVIIIDELADLMMVSGREVEESITRLAQMARAVGIHLVLATQRPSVDVITGLIKANFPARISFRVSSKVDSRTIIDGNGAEQLLGRGDMLFLPPGTSQIIRVHGAYVDEKEIAKIVDHIKRQGAPEYDETITQAAEESEDGENGLPGRNDELFFDALRACINAKRASTSLLQRHLRIGYGRAAAILDAMVREGFIGEMNGSRARPVMDKAYEALRDEDGL
ncbi:MAG TPA: DNA translocase FtsK 4TM domain-containing protein [Pyrinomonadaceae bacterium]|jgi:S-DNA-T family DNA segregation ATPase FtsK/SpoIIIE|nr:DNA translocase FtsK 4TM domain-containing protein [Pyrinomonadaceae bacterium]